MVITAQNGSDYASPRHRTIVTVCVLVGMLLLILLAACCHRNRPHNLREVTAVRLSQVYGEHQPHFTSKTIVESIPIVRYSSLNYKQKLDVGADLEANIAPSAKSRGLISLPWHKRYMKWMALDDCPVCTEAFLSSDRVRVLPCGHIYHHNCIDRWLLMFAATCPICRANHEDVVETSVFNLPAPNPVHHPN